MMSTQQGLIDWGEGSILNKLFLVKGNGMHKQCTLLLLVPAQLGTEYQWQLGIITAGLATSCKMCVGGGGGGGGGELCGYPVWGMRAVPLSLVGHGKP